jgi:aspartate/tyrosine/aromatic aminotransferase
METVSISQQLQDFFQFATERIETANTDLSLEELVQQWRKDLEHSEAVEDVRQGLIDEADGLAEPVATTFAGIRRQLGMAE